MEYYQITVTSFYGVTPFNSGFPILVLLLAVDTDNYITWVDVYDYVAGDNPVLFYSGVPAGGTATASITKSSGSLATFGNLSIPVPPNFAAITRDSLGAEYDYTSNSLLPIAYYSSFVVFVPVISGTPKTFYGSPNTVTQTSCLSDQTMIETPIGPRYIHELEPGDLVYDSHDNIATIINIWKTQEIQYRQIIQIDNIYCTEQHAILTDDRWTSAVELPHVKLAKMGRYMYQIQTDGYGVRSGRYSISTWTDHYIESHSNYVMKNFFSRH